MRYDYRCPRCQLRITLRRLVSEMDDPVGCLHCGQDMERMFTPTSNIHIPVHFKQVLTGGFAGPGQLSWSDFHDESERELAKDPHIEKREAWASQAGHGR